MLRCFYTCKKCGLERQYVQVPERVEGESLKSWMDTKLTPALVLDHRARSPLCQISEFTEVGIPHPGDAETPVGSKPSN